jgi:hypothetical protein
MAETKTLVPDEVTVTALAPIEDAEFNCTNADPCDPSHVCCNCDPTDPCF